MKPRSRRVHNKFCCFDILILAAARGALRRHRIALAGLSPIAGGAVMDVKTETKINTGNLTLGNRNWSFPLYDGTIGPQVLDVRKLYGETGIFTYDPGFTSTGSCESKITYHRRRRGHPAATAAIRSSSWPSTATFSKSATCCSTANCRRSRRRQTFDAQHHAITRWCMSRWPASSRASAATPIRWRSWSASVGALSAFYHDLTRHRRSAPAHDRLRSA